MTNHAFDADVVILGGGIAGLWLLATLTQRGYRVLLLEKTALGAGQTIASQGIIHSGLKYALTGTVNDTARRIAATADEWRHALNGEKNPDLQSAHITSEEQYVLTPKSLLGGLVNNIGGIVSQQLFGKDKIASVDERDFPAALKQTGFKGNAIVMREPVLDTQSVLQAFQNQYADSIRKLPYGMLQFRQLDHGVELLWGEQRIACQQLVSTSAAANAEYAVQFGLTVDMQQRPLRMIMVKGIDGYQLPPLWVHGATGGFRPVFTVSSHKTQQGEIVWYIGGQVAEEGVKQSDAELFAATRQQLLSYLPDLKIDHMAWSSFYISRAEGKDEKGWLPDAPIWQERSAVIFAWPTKLTFAPLLAEQIAERLHDKNIAPTSGAASWQNWPTVPVADYPWDRAEWTQL